MHSLFRHRRLSVLSATAVSACSVLWLMHVAHGQQPPAPTALFEPPAQAALPGGDTTVYAAGRNAFSLPASNLNDAERTRFVIGNSFFKRNWVEAPASTKARDGLGPHFLARSCGGCHVQDGRAQPPDFRNALGDRPPIAGLLLRLSVTGQDAHGGPLPEPVYGDQLNTFSISGVKPEGQVRIHYETLTGQFEDGTPYSLEKPLYQITELGYGPLASKTMVSPRIAPQVIGLGLLEAIPESEIHANAAAQTAEPGPIKGKVNMVWDAYGERMMLGRFGWKANVATLAHQTAGAFVGDIGITSSRFAQPACTSQQKDCLEAPHGRNHQGVEIDDKALDDVIFYQATLAPPARRSPNTPAVLRGEKLFYAMQCAQCHRPSYRTGAPPFPRLSSPGQAGQTITPYTDLLLHDMGPELADGRPDFMANGRQWRTPPLWGVGLIPDVNGHQRLMHDGRARGVLEAILWHGGEAEAARNSVRQLGADDRDALVKFVNSL